MSTSTPSVRVTAVAVSAEPNKGTKDLKYDEIRVGSQRHKLILDDDGSLRQQFPSPIELTPASQVMLCAGKRRFPIPGPKTRKIDAQRLFASATNSRTQDLSVTQDNIRITFSRQDQRSTPSARIEHTSTGALQPTTQTILEECPRFRILVIGKMGVGKSSLINIAFGINKAHTSDLQRGEAQIEEELTSPVNERFVLHDSLGFEPGDKDKYEIVKKFIRSRQGRPLKDQLHAVWFCIETPRAGGRLLETAAEDFFKSKHATLGTIPIVVVFTKLDGFIDEVIMKLMMSNQNRLSEGDITKQAHSEAVSTERECRGEIARLAGETVECAVVSTRKGYEDTISNLVQLTYRLVGTNDVPDAHATSVVTMMAQRIVPRLKIEGSITVGKQRYWKALRTSPAFAGHTIQDCLSVIHTDIVAVWNFYDPGCYLLSDKFRELVISIVQDMQAGADPNRNRILALGSGGSLVATAFGLVGVIANPAAPIIIPIVVGLAAAVWIYDVYRNAKIVQQRFIAFIVDLTHIMEALFILTGGEHKRLTRRIIKFACSTYCSSDVKSQAHTLIQDYRELDGRDAALDMIEMLIKPESSGSSDSDYYADVWRLKNDLSTLELDRDEDW